MGDSLSIYSAQATDLSIGAEAELRSILQVSIEDCELTPVPGKAHIYCSDGALLTDAGSTSTTIEVAASRSLSITDLDILIDIDHPDASQLTVTLTSPGSTNITLWDRDCSDTAGVNFVANDEGLETNQCRHFSAGTLHVDVDAALGLSAMSLLDGEMLTGTWTLEVQDHVAGQTGRINTFCLIAE